MGRKIMKEIPFHLMLLPAVVILIIYNYVPMAGIGIAFQKYVPTYGLFGSAWVGLDNFIYIIKMPDIFQVLWNTVYIAVMKIIGGLLVPVVFALLLNEVKINIFKRSIQTLVYLPHFLSWVILGGILIDILSPSNGFVNEFLSWFGFEPIFFLGNSQWFPYVMVISHIWKEFGFGTIVYFAALTNINPMLYESSIIDGANRWKQTFYITIPGITPIVILMSCLSLGNVLNAGFEQVFNLYNPAVYSTGDIIDTMVYRLGLEQIQFSVATAVRLFKSVVSFLLISLSYKAADKFANYRIF